MATLKPVVLTGKKQGNRTGEHNIKICVTHYSKSAYIKTPYYIHPSFMLRSGKISNKYEDYNSLNEQLKILVMNYNSKLIKLGTSIEEFSVKELKGFLIQKNDIRPSKEKLLFFPMAYRRILELKSSDKRRWITYNESMKQIEKFKPDLEIDKIDVDFLEQFERYQLTKEKPVKLNTISVRIRAFSAIYNDIIKKNPILKTLNNPFKEYKIRHNQPPYFFVLFPI